MSDIATRLRATTEIMACTASVDMTIWNKHSNACLEAAAEIEKLQTALKAAYTVIDNEFGREMREAIEARAAAAAIREPSDGR